MPKSSSAAVIHTCFSHIRNARAAIGMCSSAALCSEMIDSLSSGLNELAEGSRDKPTTDALLAVHRDATERLAGGNVAEDHKELIKLLISLDELYYRLYYLAQSSAGMGSVLPDPSAYFNGWAWAPKHGTVAAYTEAHLPGQQSSAIMQEVLGFGGARDRSQAERAAEDNLLLRLLKSRWLETAERFEDHPLAGLSVCVAQPPTKGQIVTMKGGDPKCEPLMCEWRDSCRDFSCHLFAYAVPSDAALQEMASHGGLVEVGAGLGYWASLLRARGVDIAVYDKSPTSQSHNEYHGRAKAWCSVTKGDADCVQQHADKALLLCYPPPASSMAALSLQMYLKAGGKTVLYVGEWFGDTGTSEFQVQLNKTCLLVKRVALPNWSNTSYELTVWKVRSDQAAEDCVDLPILSCAACGKTENLRRCRFSCEVCFCSQDCQEAHWPLHKELLALKHVVLGAGCGGPKFKNGNHFKVLKK